MQSLREVVRPLGECLLRGKRCGPGYLLPAVRQQSSVAVVGTGPAGIYFVDRLKRFVSDPVRVDLFERLPVPFGLVRSGVAPDHPDTKKVINKLTAVCQSDGVRFLGNVAVGSDVSVQELQQHYSAVVLAYGAEDDRELGLENEHVKGVLSARRFVNWYNGHPRFTDVSLPSLQTVDTVGIIGLGNVALDCARILLRPVEDLLKTDTADHALAELRSSSVQNVHVIGRKGPFQAQFSGKELRELLSLSNVSISVHPVDYWPTDIDMQEGTRSQKVVKEMLTADGKESTAHPHRNLHFHFLESPARIHLNSNSDQIASLEVATQSNTVDHAGRQMQVATGETLDIPMQLLLKSVGYRGCGLPGAPFQQNHGTVPNTMGRVTSSDDGSVVPGLYATGWIRRGPQGIIGTNIMDAQQTAMCLAEDIKKSKLASPPAGGDMQQILQDRGVQVVTWEGWQEIDAEERRLGTPQGRPRVKITDVDSMLEIAGKVARKSSQGLDGHS